MKKPLLLIILIFTYFKSLKVAKSFTIDCVFVFRDLNVVGNVYRCETADISISSGEAVTRIAGYHLNNYNNENVTAIHINGNRTLSFFPRDLHIFFPNLRAIIVVYSIFDTLFGNELKEFLQLKYFYLNHSNLTTISSRLFKRNPKMGLVNFDFNRIQRVGYDLFTPLNISMLTLVYFSSNVCISQRASNSPNTIPQLINNLRIQCPYDDENLSCIEGNIEEFVCNIDEKVDEIQTNLDNTKEKFENELKDTREEIEKLQSEIQWLKDEILKLTTNPCACK